MKKLYFIAISCMALGFASLQARSHEAPEETDVDVHEYIDRGSMFVPDEYRDHSLMFVLDKHHHHVWQRNYTDKNCKIMDNVKKYHHKLRTLYPHHATTQREYAIADLAFELAALHASEKVLSKFSSPFLFYFNGISYIPNAIEKYFNDNEIVVGEHRIFRAWRTANKDFVVTGSFDDEVEATKKEYANYSLEALEKAVVDTHKKLKEVVYATPSSEFVSNSIMIPLMAGTLVVMTSGINFAEKNGYAADLDR